MQAHQSTNLSQQLLSSHFVDCTVLRLALQHSLRSGPVKTTGAVLTTKLEFLKTSLQIYDEQRPYDPKWLVVCAFLWTSWYRFLLLHLWAHMSKQSKGFKYNDGAFTMLRGLSAIPSLRKFLEKKQAKSLERTPYLCGWAYRMLRNDRACISMDLRRFHELYHDVFSMRKAICNAGDTQCSGTSSSACGRFRNTSVANQSMHTTTCNMHCARLYWDRKSFLSVSGPKAIDIDATTNHHSLQYCEANEKTLTISHVWSHGQGGRPDGTGPEGTGFNQCLHQRYATLATSRGYASYWMDTPCIPSEPSLRWECIENIVGIFSRSEMTVVCDRDLMNIDISNITLEVCEAIFAVLLVCDWNMRAWTLLEAMRGRSALYLLCRDERLISISEVLRTVQDSGRIDLLVLLLTRSYLFPPRNEDFEIQMWDDRDDLSPIRSDQEEIESSRGYISIGEAAALLSLRHPTRDDDDLLIWSLLIGDLEDEQPLEMWKRQIGRKIHTGSLLSSAPRVQHAPFGWAPSRPSFRHRTESFAESLTVYPAFDGAETATGEITADGFHAPWLTYEFSTSSSGDDEDEMEDEFCGVADLNSRLRYITKLHVHDFQSGMLLHPCPPKGPKSVIGMGYRGCEGALLVICGSMDRLKWQWRAVFEWDNKVALPPLTFKNDVWLV